MPNTNPTPYGRQPSDGPEVSRAELDQRQARALNRTNNGKIEDAKRKPWITPERSQK